MKEPIVVSTAIPFSWSVRREKRWARCPRSVFLHYYAASGGADPDAGKETRFLHELRELLGIAAYAKELVADELRTLFYQEEGDLATRVHRRRLREWRSMVLGEPLADHRRPLLAELYYSPGESRRIGAEVEAEVNRILALPELRELVDRLSLVPALDRLAIPRPLAIHLGELAVYGAPLLAFRDGAKLVFLEIQRGRAEEIAAAAPMIHRYYALEHLKITPERVLSWHLDTTDGSRAESPLDLSGAIDRVQRGAAEMLACILPDGRAAELDFEAKLQHCGQCRFRKYCLS